MDQQPDGGKQNEADKRESFRIHDSLSVFIQKVEENDSQFQQDLGLEELQPLFRSALQEGIPPSLLKILIQLYRKMDFISKQIPIDILKVKTQPVNLSATGMSLLTQQRFTVNDQVKIKILLPTLPVREILVDGKVVRVIPKGDRQYDLGLEFLELDEEVREELFHYSLKKQREAVLTHKLQKGKDGTISGKGQ